MQVIKESFDYFLEWWFEFAQNRKYYGLGILIFMVTWMFMTRFDLLTSLNKERVIAIWAVSALALVVLWIINVKMQSRISNVASGFFYAGVLQTLSMYLVYNLIESDRAVAALFLSIITLLICNGSALFFSDFLWDHMQWSRESNLAMFVAIGAASASIVNLYMLFAFPYQSSESNFIAIAFMLFFGAIAVWRLLAVIDRNKNEKFN